MQKSASLKVVINATKNRDLIQSPTFGKNNKNEESSQVKD